MPLKERYRYRWVKNLQFAPIKGDQCGSTDDIVEVTAWLADEGNREVTFFGNAASIFQRRLPTAALATVTAPTRSRFWHGSHRHPIENCPGLILHFEIPTTEEIVPPRPSEA
jgi:hypothetical protein